MDRCSESELFEKATQAFSSDVIIKDTPAHQTRCSTVITVTSNDTTMYHSRGVPFGRRSYKRVGKHEITNHERWDKGPH